MVFPGKLNTTQLRKDQNTQNPGGKLAIPQEYSGKSNQKVKKKENTYKKELFLLK